MPTQRHDRHRSRRTGAVLLCATFLVHPASAGRDAAAPDGLQARVIRYFKTDSPDARAAIAQEIESMDGVTLDAVADAVRRAPLWKPSAPEFERFDLQTARGTTTEVHVHVPDGYDPGHAYPLLLAFHGQDGNGGQYIHFALQLLGDRVNEFLVAAPTRLGGCFIGSAPETSTDPTALFRALKTRYRVDTARVYASGYSKGGHQSFLLGLLYTDTLAAAVPLAGTFTTQIGLELVDIMLPNLRGFPMLVVYGELDHGQPRGPIDERSGISGANRYIRLRAAALNVPIEMIEIPGMGHVGVRPPPDRFHAMLNKVRPRRVKTIDHWFRYPPQGRVDWLRQTRYQGTPWRGDHLRVKPKGDETYSDALVRKLKLILPYIGGTIEGQAIDIRTRRTARVDLLLNDDLVDLDREITVRLKGKLVFTGRAHRSIRTLLEVAYEDWDFQRLYPVRFTVTRNGDVRQY